MRISTNQITLQNAAQMQRLSQDVAATQFQIGTGRRFTSAGEDPIGAAKEVRLEQEIGLRNQYGENIGFAESQLVQEETILDQASNLLQRIRELVIQAGNGVQTNIDRGFLATEIEARADELYSLMNSRSSNGDYVFAGFQAQNAPFERVGTEAVYRGDEGQRFVQIGQGHRIAMSDSGARVFEAVSSDRVRLRTGDPRQLNEGSGAVSGLVIQDQESVNQFYPDQLVIEFASSNDTSNAQPLVTVRRASDRRVVEGYDSIPYKSGMQVNAVGANFRLTGEPDAGDRLVVDSTQRQNILSSVGQLAQGLRDIDPSVSPDALQSLLDNSVGIVESAETRILEVRADIGARLNTLDSTENFHADVKLQTQEVLADVRDLDYAEAVSELSLRSFVLEAAQQSFARIANLSLFNSL
ncbi:MAG: flagellar hook-associated protein FlgL [Pseudomonadaceae bacterium]|nr:flagellar hook-associated protein FlgL [Pseudomonadaceae bacterium]